MLNAKMYVVGAEKSPFFSSSKVKSGENWPKLAGRILSSSLRHGGGGSGGNPLPTYPSVDPTPSRRPQHCTGDWDRSQTPVLSASALYNAQIRNTAVHCRGGSGKKARWTGPWISPRLKAPIITFLGVAMVNFFGTECKANDVLSGPPRHDSKVPLSIFSFGDVQLSPTSNWHFLGCFLHVSSQKAKISSPKGCAKCTLLKAA